MKNKKGFTLVELLLVFTVMSILFGAGVPSIQAYYKNAGTQDILNRSDSIFYAAQHTVTSMNSSTQMDLFRKRVVNYATPIDSVLFDYLNLVDDSSLQTRYYSIQFKKSERQFPSEQGQMVLDLLDNLIMNSDILQASIVIELDLYTYTVQTVFYTLSDTEFHYGIGSGISLLDRSPEQLQFWRLGMTEADAVVKVLSLGTEVSQEPFRVPNIVGDIDWTNPNTGVGWWEDSPSEMGGTAWVVTDPTISPSNPIPVQLMLAGVTHIKSFRVHWWSSLNGPPITYEYYLWYRQQNSTDWMMIPEKYISSGDTIHEIVYKTMEIRIDILKNDSTDFKYGIYEWALYDDKGGTGNIIPVVTVSIINR